MAGWICLGAAAAGFLLLYVLSIWEAKSRYRKECKEEKEFRAQMMLRKRLIDWPEVAAKLKGGEGTLIVQHVSPKGPIRDWWVPDDLLALAPVALPRSIKAPLENAESQRVREYAAACNAKYIDTASGTASLTDYPLCDAELRDPRKLVVVDLGDGLMTAIRMTKGRKIDAQFPNAKVVTLICWSEPPFIALGDASTVFLGSLTSTPQI